MRPLDCRPENSRGNVVPRPVPAADLRHVVGLVVELGAGQPVHRARLLGRRAREVAVVVRGARQVERLHTWGSGHV